MTQIEALLGFLGEAVTPFHAVAAMSRRLLDAGFKEVERFDPAAMTAGCGYYMTRQGSSLIAMRMRCIPTMRTSMMTNTVRDWMVGL